MFLQDTYMSYSLNLAYIFNLLYIDLFEWKNKEIIKCLKINNPMIAGSKPLSGFKVRSTERVTGISTALVINSKLSP